MWVVWAGVASRSGVGIGKGNGGGEKLEKVEVAPALIWRGCMLAAVNPKTLLFNAAFLPQFISIENGAAGQLAAVATVFLAVLLAGDMLWAFFAATAHRLFEKHLAMRNRLTGGILVAAGIGLALSRRTQ